MKILTVEPIKEMNGKWIVPYTRESRRHKTLPGMFYFTFEKNALKKYMELSNLIASGKPYIGKKAKKRLKKATVSYDATNGTPELRAKFVEIKELPKEVKPKTKPTVKTRKPAVKSPVKPKTKIVIDKVDNLSKIAYAHKEKIVNKPKKIVKPIVKKKKPVVKKRVSPTLSTKDKVRKFKVKSTKVAKPKNELQNYYTEPHNTSVPRYKMVPVRSARSMKRGRPAKKKQQSWWSKLNPFKK